jgi:hypothetical protein
MKFNAVYLFTKKPLLRQGFRFVTSLREHCMRCLTCSNFTGSYKQSQLNAQVSLNYLISQYVVL